MHKKQKSKHILHTTTQELPFRDVCLSLSVTAETQENQLVRDFYFFTVGVLCSFSPFRTLFCSTPTLFLAIMEIQHWWKTVKWSLKSFICFLFLLSCFMLSNSQLAIDFPGLFWKHCTSSLQGGFAQVLPLLLAQLQLNSPGRKTRAEDIPGLWGSICLLLLMADLHDEEADPKSSLSLGRSMPALRDEKHSWQTLGTPQPLSEVLESLSFPSHFNNSKIRSVGTQCEEREKLKPAWLSTNMIHTSKSSPESSGSHTGSWMLLRSKL